MEEHSWETKPSLFDRCNLLDPSKFADLYFHGNLFHRKREWPRPFHILLFAILPFVPLFPSHQIVQHPTMQKPDGLLLMTSLCIKLLQLIVVFSVSDGASNSDFAQLKLSHFKHAQETTGSPNLSFCETEYDKFQIVQFIKKLLTLLFKHLLKKERNILCQNTTDFLGLPDMLYMTGNFNWLAIPTSFLLTFQTVS